MNISGVGIWSAPLRYGDPGEAADAASELEQLGFSALWIPDVGGPVLDSVANLLGATTTTVVATGILNIWMHEPKDVAAAHARLTAEHGPRFLLGLGISHAPLIDAHEAGRYQKPLATTKAFLDGLDDAEHPVPTDSRMLAALGPKMLELAADRTAGTHPYLVTPEHTAAARAALGEGPLVAPEQTAILATDRDEARSIAGKWLRGYLAMPNYANNLRRLGFSEEDLTSVSDKLFDALIAWGDEAAVLARIDEHRAAGADHVCVQVLHANHRGFPREQWRRLAAALG
ncbi:LLM class F420-dependent oxidoreductase [Gordonia rhizosphera]|uniref:LLM class F420-dependent oxidoreductase n=1 Tax=Gordonia rhizosphera TaxID=83341 RepID=UPI00058DA712|nr:LLM class F420-dependent oxidoreductase [Gordonia rhizosphera]